MSTVAEETISMKLIPLSGEKLMEMSQTKLPPSALDGITMSKEQLFSIGLGVSNFNSEKKTEPSLSPQFQFSSTNSLSQPVENNLGSKPKKRTRSKSGLKNRKKGKLGTSSNSPNDDALDIDLRTFVESLDTNKNLDSDSSTNTIILDDIKDVESKLCVNVTEKRTKSVPGEYLLNDTNFQDGSDKHSHVTAISQSNAFLSSNKDEHSLLYGPKEISTNFYNSSKGRLLISQKPSVPEGACSPLIKFPNMEGISQKTAQSESSISLQSKLNQNLMDNLFLKKEDNPDKNKKYLLNVPNISPVFMSASSPQSHLRSLLTNKHVTNHLAQSYSLNIPQQNCAEILPGVQVSEDKEQLSKNFVSSASLCVPNVCEQDQRLNSQSVYASMGLDEDLCDLDDQNPRQKGNIESVSKDSHHSLFSNEFHTVQFPIKSENDASSPFIPAVTRDDLMFHPKNEILASNDLHVSMTFEAEPSVDDDDDEDDLPLAQLKNQISTEEILPRMKEKSKELSNLIADNVSDIHPSLFIKKELIEDEIVSESQAVSSKSLLSVSVPSHSSEVKTSISTSHNDVMAVQIKTEPVDDYPSSETTEKSSVSLSLNPSQVSAHNTGLIPKASTTGEHNSVSEPTVNKIISQSCNTKKTMSPSLIPKSQLEGKLNVNTVSYLPSVSIQEPNFTGNVSDTSVTVTKKSKTNSACKKRKSSAKNTNVSKNVKKSSSVDEVPHNSLTEEALQNFSLCDGNSDLNFNQQVADTDTESNSSKKRGKRKRSSKAVNIDENVPITLLFKRKKSEDDDENMSNSFLCTNISKSSAGESKSSSALSTPDRVVMASKVSTSRESTSSDVSDLSLHSGSLVMQQKNKKEYKKKQTRTPKGKSKFSCNIDKDVRQHENQISNSLNVTVKPNDNPCSSDSKLNTSISKNSSHLQSSKFSDTQTVNSLNTQSQTEQKCGTFHVYMTFEEQSPEDDINEDDINSVLPIKKERDPSPPRESVKSSDVSPDILSVIRNIKQEKEDFLHPESQVSEVSTVPPSDYNPESSHSSQVETLSIVSSVASNSNIDDDSTVSAFNNFDNSVSDSNLNIQSKKKKRRPKSNGWYKKKKSKIKSQNLPSVEIKEPANLTSVAANKVPVVIIKNLLPEIKFSKRDGSVKINNTVCLEQETAKLPTKSKNKNKTASKKKKKAQVNENLTNNETIHADSGLEQETAKLPTKSKNKKKTASKNKKKKKAQVNENCTNNEIIHADSGLECERVAKLLNCLQQNELVPLPVKANFGKDISTDTSVSVSDQCSEIQVTTSENSSKFHQGNLANKLTDTNVCDVASSPVNSGNEKSHTSSENSSKFDQVNPANKPLDTNNVCGFSSSLVNSGNEKSHGNLFPSLDVDKIRQEIAACEARLQSFGEPSDKCRQRSSGYDGREELSMQLKVTQPNILETFNSSFKSRKSKSFDSCETFSCVKIKKECIDDFNNSVQSPKEVSLLHPNEKINCLLNATQVSKENSELVILPYTRKEVGSTVQDKSASNSTVTEINDKLALESNVTKNISDGMIDSVSEIIVCPAVQSESLKNLAQDPLPVDIDKIALSIKKEVYGDAKSRPSNYGIKDQNELIQKVCEPEKLFIPSSFPGSSKSVSSMQSDLPDSEQKCDLVDDDDEIQILKIANQSSTKDVPIVDLTEENNINGPAPEIQDISECKVNSTKNPPLHINTTKVSDQSNADPEYSTKVSSVQSSGRHTDQGNAMHGYAIQGNVMQQSPSQINFSTVCGQIYERNRVIKTENSDINSTPVIDCSFKENSHLKENNKQAVINNGTKKSSLVAGHEENHRMLLRNNEDSLEFAAKDEEDFLVKVKVSNSTISKDKYSEEYFKHPFPPSIVLHNIKQRNKNKMYTRINSKAWNLSVEEVENRLKLSENIIPQPDADSVSLERYPVSVNEVECYHRILGVAPSHKLLSKCFKSPEKKRNTFINNGFNVLPPFPQANVNSFESQKIFNKGTCSLDDIIKGISETKMMYSNNNAENNFSVIEKDCPSTESRDSCDSYISNRSAIQSRDLKISNTINKVEKEFIHNENSNGRSSALSCRSSTFNERDLTNPVFMTHKSPADQFVSSLNSNEMLPSQNTLNCFSLPGQETINSNNPSSSSCVSTYDNISNYYPELKNNAVKSIESQLSSSCQSFSTELKSNDESKLQSEKKQVFDIDVPVTELRKILEAAGSLCSDTISYDDGSMWKSKATYEYNHTQSMPVGKNPEYNSLGNVLPSQIVPFSSYASQSTPQQNEGCSQLSNEALTNSKSTLNADTYITKKDSLLESDQDSFAKRNVQDSDSDCVDNEPICNDDYDRDRDESSSHVEEHAIEERPVPQYKSKWEKIMERKSLENKERETVNEHLLKDCFPVRSTRTQSKISHTSHKDISRSNKKLNKSSKDNSSDKRQKKNVKTDSQDKNVKQKQRDSVSSKLDLAKQNNKCSNSSKEKIEKNRNKSNSEKETRNKASVCKKNRKPDEDGSNLFTPDKSIKISKPDTNHQSNENSKTKRFYGNRVTNRGTFLTESSSPSELLKKIKIPKKKKLEIPKKHNSVRSEEFHSMVKSPDINIEPAFHSSYKNFNKSLDSRKNSESYRSPLESTSSSSSSYFVRTKHGRGRRMYHSNFHSQERQQYHKIPFDRRSYQSKNFRDESIVGRKPATLNMPPNISPLMNDETNMNRKTALLSTPSIPGLTSDESTVLRKTSQFSVLSSLSSHQSYDGSVMGRNNSHLSSVPSIPSHLSNDESLLGKKIPNLITSPSIPSKLPVDPLQPNVIPDMNLLHTIIAVIKNNKISPVPEELTSSDGVNSLDKYESNSLAYSFNESSSKQAHSILPGQPAASKNKSFGNVHPPDFFDTLKPSSAHPFPTAPLKNPFDSPVMLNSPPCSASVSSGTHIPSQPNRKATCLVPQHLKTWVGHKTIETHNVRLLMLEWSVDWLVQQQQFQDPPPISNALKKVVSTYDSFEDYYNTYFPLLLLETWHRIYVSWTHLNQANPYSCQITSYSVKSQYVSVECQTVFNTAAHPKGVFPDEGNILMVKYTTKSNEYTIKILGYVTHVKTRRFNCVTDSKLFSSLRLHKDANPDVLQILSLTFMAAFNSEDIDKRQPIRIHVLCNVKPTLKQNDAMLHINNSPLQRSILNPVADGLLSFTLTPRNSPLEETNECVRDITKGILTPHPLPLLTVVRAKPESDRLNIIPMLIEKMKVSYKTKVLLCVRTVRALGDIAANICLHQSLKLVIVNKRCDTNPQFQKYLLDDIVTAEMNKCSDDKVNDKHHAKADNIMKIKKQVLKECDVVLSLIRNCHDEFISETFTETDCVSQMCCIVDEANLCTEPETLIPILHGISKLILIGDSDYPAKVLSKTASAYDYSQSFFQRAYDLDLITE